MGKKLLYPVLLLVALSVTLFCVVTLARVIGRMPMPHSEAVNAATNVNSAAGKVDADARQSRDALAVCTSCSSGPGLRLPAEKMQPTLAAGNAVRGDAVARAANR